MSLLLKRGLSVVFFVLCFSTSAMMAPNARWVPFKTQTCKRATCSVWVITSKPANSLYGRF